MVGACGSNSLRIAQGAEIKLKAGSLARWLRPEPGTLSKDAVAGLPSAIAGVPDGMAAAVLVGVNPVYGLYASFAGPIAGGLTACCAR